MTNEVELSALGSPTLLALAVLCLPIYVQVLFTACVHHHCSITNLLTTCTPSTPISINPTTFVQSAHCVVSTSIPPITLHTFSPILFFYLTQMAARAIFPGPTFTNTAGVTYRVNGRAIFIASIASTVAFALSEEGRAAAADGRLGTAVLAALTGAQVVSLAVSLALLFVGRFARGSRAPFAVELFMGILENPRLLPTQTWTDLKFIFESQALVCWIVMDVALLALGTPSNRLLATIILHTAYICHHFADESFLLNTLDFLSEPLGFMLTWGNIVFVGFAFALPTWTAAQAKAGSPDDLSLIDASLIVAAGLYGLLVFHQSNHQKHDYRRDPSSATVWGSAPRTLPTARGTRLLLSGWYGVARHANYLGDLLLALAIALASGTSYFTSWTYFAYLTVLLVHRARRDDQFCAAKYGADWDTYKQHTPYVILPGVY